MITLTLTPEEHKVLKESVRHVRGYWCEEIYRRTDKKLAKKKLDDIKALERKVS